ncbi:MAG: hypothetical protein H0T79_02680, partial [Deltaproteobacteria bacterium]|nr:hypothetical protein [Deltaproteobacteria bacterium]
IRGLNKNSVSSELRGADAIGTTGTLTLPVAKDRPGKVRIEQKGRSEDFVANLIEDGEPMPTGTSVLVVSEGEHGSLVVTRSDV